MLNKNSLKCILKEKLENSRREYKDTECAEYPTNIVVYRVSIGTTLYYSWGWPEMVEAIEQIPSMKTAHKQTQEKPNRIEEEPRIPKKSEQEELDTNEHGA